MFMGFQTKRESRQRSETEHTRTTGTIIDYARGEHRSGRRGVHVYWKPVVEFLAEGQKYRAEYPNRMDRDQFPIGTEVDILYELAIRCISIWRPIRYLRIRVAARSG